MPPPSTLPERPEAHEWATASRRELLQELRSLSHRLAEAEDTLRAIHDDEIDALIVLSRSRGLETTVAKRSRCIRLASRSA